MPGKVVDFYTDGYDVKVRAMYDTELKNGDKLSTCHGQKGVCVIVDDFPFGVDTERNEVVEFDICSSCTSAVNRCTPGQLLEGQQQRGGNVFGSGRCSVYSNDVMVLTWYRRALCRFVMSVEQSVLRRACDCLLFTASVAAHTIHTIHTLSLIHI